MAPLKESPVVDFLLVGGGLASATAAETLRAAGAEGSIAEHSMGQCREAGKRLAAWNMLGERQSWRTVSYIFSSVFDVTFNVVGSTEES